MAKNGKVTLAVTGATGFIGRGVLRFCAEKGIKCRGVSRAERPAHLETTVEWARVPAYDRAEDLATAFAGADFVLHLADNPSRGEARDPDSAARISAAVIAAMRAAGLRKAIVASSVYARDADSSRTGSYGAGKRAIEEAFLSADGIETVVLRLPPIYGPGGKGGIATLAGAVRRGLPLPFGSATAERAYLSRTNLASLIQAIVSASPERWKGAAGKIFEPSDGQSINTRDLIRHMAAVAGVKPKLLPVPLGVLRLAGRVTGKGDMVEGAVGPLDVAPVAELERHFGWRPLERMPESLAYLSSA